MNRIHEQCPKIRLRKNTESNRAKNRLSAPSAQPLASPRAQAARLAPRLRACRALPRAPHARLRPAAARLLRERPPACAPRRRSPRARAPACAPSDLPNAYLPCLWSQYTQVYCDTIPPSPLPFPGHDTKLYCDPVPFKPTSFTAIQFYVLQYNFSNQLPAIHICIATNPSKPAAIQFLA